MVKDLHTAMAFLSARAPGKKRILLGHSMGSFLAREYILRYPDGADALVLSGSGFHPKALCLVAKTLARAQRLFMDGKSPSKLLDTLAFSANNKPFAGPGISKYAWLSRDKAQVAAYEQDPFCGFVFSVSGFYDLFSGLHQLTKLSRFAALPKALPIYFMSGLIDPVGQSGRGIHTLAAQYQGAGLTNVTVRLYEDARHELFNEINREEVILDLVSWLHQTVLQEVPT